MKRKLLLMVIGMFATMFTLKGVYAASASISANKTSVTVGTKVTVTVKINAAAWNVAVSGSASGSIVGANMDAENQTTTKTYTINTKKAGKYTVYLKGDITDESSETATNVNKSVTITVKEKQTTTTKPTTNTTTTNTTTTNKKTTTNTTTTNKKPTETTKKSSNANISNMTLNVEGLSFKSNQTTYSIKVGENVENISLGITLASSKATYTVTGNKGLKAGNNVIKIVVTAEDGTKKTYKINVSKAGNVEESSSELSNLIIENMTLEPEFESTTTEYVGSKMKFTDKLNILPYTVSEKATYEIIGNENLKEGQNTIIVKVTSLDKTSTTEYKVVFEMVAKEETNALQVVNPYVEQEPVIQQNDSDSSSWKQILVDNATIILLYILALIEFAQVVYLYVELKSVNPDAITVKRRKNK